PGGRCDHSGFAAAPDARDDCHRRADHGGHGRNRALCLQLVALASEQGAFGRIGPAGPRESGNFLCDSLATAMVAIVTALTLLIESASSVAYPSIRSPLGTSAEKTA